MLKAISVVAGFLAIAFLSSVAASIQNKIFPTTQNVFVDQILLTMPIIY